MACRLIGTKTLSETMMVYCSLEHLGLSFNGISMKIQDFSFTKMHLKMSEKWRQFCLRLIVLTH